MLRRLCYSRLTCFVNGTGEYANFSGPSSENCEARRRDSRRNGSPRAHSSICSPIHPPIQHLSKPVRVGADFQTLVGVICPQGLYRSALELLSHAGHFGFHVYLEPSIGGRDDDGPCHCSAQI